MNECQRLIECINECKNECQRLIKCINVCINEYMNECMNDSV